MPGGLLNLVSEGLNNSILNGNPSKTFFKTTYNKYTNFGLQKFRLDYEGSSTLKLQEESVFTFNVPRYGDLLMDTFVSVTLPNIWSPIMPPRESISSITNDALANTQRWAPYEFKWIENIGAKMISKISISCGGQLLQEYSGDYLLSMAQRDFTANKYTLFSEMIGNVPELNDPANAGAKVNSYPNAYYTEDPNGSYPSINGRTLYIPLNAWFCLYPQNAFPLISMQYNILTITIVFRPINKLFQIRDVYDSYNNFPYVAPNFNLFYSQMYRFLQTPPDTSLGIDSYVDKRSVWDADIHLVSTYCFLSEQEQRIFATKEQTYIVKQVFESIFYNVTGPNRVEVNSLGLVSNWMFYFQRSDANLRNEWSNYTNWPYSYLPYDVIVAPAEGNVLVYRKTFTTPYEEIPFYIGPGVEQNGNQTGLMITGVYKTQNIKEILLNMGILMDGSYRENTLPAGVYNYIEKYNATKGNAPPGLFCYNFCLNTDPTTSQTSGAINMSMFNKIEFEFTTIIPPLDPLAQMLTVCDPVNGELIGINKPTWRIYEYNFNLILFEERINVLTFMSGNCGLMYAN
jgi:hypothetical protein